MEKITDIREIQEILYNLLNHFADVCRKYGLRYYLSNGTLLGAVKYKGFIPWDDDIDVMMPREDYEKLISLEEINENGYSLLADNINKDWRFPFAKLVDKRTILKETTLDAGCEMGVFIDIFPIDNWSNNRIFAKLEATYAGLLRRFFSASLEYPFFSPRKGVKRLILYLIWLFSRKVGFEKLKETVYKLSKKHKNSRYKGCVVWAAYGTGEIIPAEAFEKTETVVFEGREFLVFYDWENYLRGLYGDFDKELPRDRKKTHHTFTIYKKTVD